MSEKRLTVYYSWSGNTRKTAEMIHEMAGGEIIEICPRVPYPREYSRVLNQVKTEIKNGFRPELEPSIGSIEPYSSIFVGSPNWWNTIAPPVASFLKEHDFTGKRLLPFCTHGGGGGGRMADTIAELCPSAAVLDCMEFYGSGSGPDRSVLTEWIQHAGIV